MNVRQKNIDIYIFFFFGVINIVTIYIEKSYSPGKLLVKLSN